MKTIGYKKAQSLMSQSDWKLRVTMEGEELQRVGLYHPNQPTVYVVRKDSYHQAGADFCGEA